MGRTRSALLALATMMVAVLLSAGSASAATAVIDARDDSPGPRWVPNTVTINAGDTVRWEFDDAATGHDIQSSSPNWELDTEIIPPDGTPVEHSFGTPGTYTFLCTLHQGMTGTITVEEAAELENVLVFSKTGGFRHGSIPAGIQAIQQLGAANGFSVTATEDSTAFTDQNLAQYDVVVFLSTTGEILNAEQQAAFERYIQGGGGFAGIHAASDTEYTWPWYGELVGGYFRSHPPGTPTATVRIEDADEPSTSGIPAAWTRTDEWYNFQDTTQPVVGGNGTVADYSPRARHVHVLATVDEATYDEQDGNTVDDDHPVAWCSDFDGGRSWYTAMGHTTESFAEPDFREHLLGGLQTAAGADAECGERRDTPPVEDDFEKITINDDTKAPMEVAPTPDGRLFYIELGQPKSQGQPNEATAELMVWDPNTGNNEIAHTLTVDNSHENGLLGLTLAPDFATSGHIYMAYSKFDPAAPINAKPNVVSRFTIGPDSKVVAGSEVPIFVWTHQRAQCCHTGGSLVFGTDGNLYISTGDNTNPFAHGYNPTDERPGREPWDAQRTSANTNDHNGKVLRIRPRATPMGSPGVGTTYDIPTGNMFPVGTAQTLPEIYAMGFRNPFRIHVDRETGWVLLGDYGPDQRNPDTTNRGPEGSVEYNVVTQPGFYGWPYCIRENVPYNDIEYAEDNGSTGTNKGKYNCAAPVNDSPNNTGLRNLPPAQPATMWMAYTQTDNRFPGLGTGGAPTGGPRYYYEEGAPQTAFPKFYDGHWFIGEWNNDWVKTATLNDKGLSTGVSCFAICDGYVSPMDLEFGANGSLYVAEWGQGFAENNDDSGVYRIDYVKGGRLPIARATATPDGGPLPLEVQFSSAGSNDPDGTAITYAWDFDGDGDTDSTEPNPVHTYTTAGTFSAKLTVTDESGAVGTNTVTVVAGNTRPVVTIEIPENGRVADFGEKIPYRVSVTDAEDGTTGNGISCNSVQIEKKLGHDTHAHELGSVTGCEGVITIEGMEGHGPDANVFTVITAAYTDRGNGAAGPVTGRAEAIVQPRLKQAEYFQTTGRTADGRGTGTPGAQLEATTDVGGGNAAAFIEDGDWISFNPYNLEELDKVTFRVASETAGANIQLRYDAPDGPLVAETGLFTPTGGWQVWRDVVLDLPETVPAGTHRLYVVFRHPTNTGGLMNLNWFKFAGKGAAITTPPEVTATADPASGEAPLQVAFDAEATDAEGEALTYAWDFGVAGTTTDTSTEEDPTYTYERPGNYTATVRVTDAQGSSSTATVDVRATRAPEQCPTGPVRSDEFDGDALDTERWDVIRPDTANPLSVANGSLKLPIANGSIYLGGTTAKNIVVQDTPEGEWMATAKVTVDALTEDYHQAGLRVYADDNNWASVHMIHAGGQRDIEFIWESNGNPRNEGADKLGGIPATAPLTYYVRLVSDGTQLTAFYSFDGDTFLPVGRPGSLATFNNPKIGPVALSDAAPSVPNAYFDWIRFEPDGSGGGPGNETLDEFDGSALGPDWSVVRQNQALSVSGGALHIPAQPGDIYGTSPNSAQNLVLRDAPDGPWTATAKVAFEGTHQWHQAGMLVYGDDDNFTKLGRLSTDAGGNGTEKFEFIHENAGTPRNAAEDSTASLPATFPRDYYVRIVSDGTNITGAYSTDGTTWTPVGRAAPLPANPRIGLFAFSNAATTAPIAAFDSFTLEGVDTGGGGGGPTGPSYDDHFEGSTLDKQRWNAIVRDVPSEYAVTGGKLRITTSAGDIYTGDTNPPPNNFILQSADHAGADWVIETKIDGATINGGYGQGGLMAYSDGDNYVKFDAISDDGQTRINRLELRSEIGGAIQQPQPADPQIAAGVSQIWLRLTKTGDSYAGEYSLDGATWTAISAPVTNPMDAPDFGLFAIGPLAAGQGDVVPFEYFTLDGEDPDQCECVSNGDEFDGTSLNTSKFNAIAHDDPSKYKVENGALTVTTTLGEIYQSSTGGGPLILQSADHAGADWTIETKLSHTLDGGYSQGGLMAYAGDNDYVKINAISDANNATVNRLELRSETGGTVPNPGTDPQVPAGTQNIWLRLTKAGQTYSGQYSFDGTTWTPFGYTVTNAMASPRFGLYTQGVQQGGDTVTFDYFALDGERGCPGQEPENEAPVIDAVTANPTIGLAPLPVEFSADASDADGDELSYSWDFDGDGTEDADTAEATHTYTAAGTYEAEVTVSDGTDETTDTVTVQVLPADDPQARFRTLVFSKTTGFRHGSIPVGIQAIRELGEANDFQVDATEDASVFRDGLLARYDTVVFLSTTGDPLNAEQQAAFEPYSRGGAGITRIHAAADTEYNWNWYGRLVGGYFKSHPPGTPEATVHVEDQDHHSTEGIPTPWERVDEWYNYRSPEPGAPTTDWSPRLGGVHVLMTVDEATYDEQDENTTDDDHPISWCQRYDGGRSWYTGMGHTDGTFGEADFRRHLLGGLEVTAGVVEDETCGVSTDITLEAFADPASGPAPLTVNFSATAMDPDGDDLTYRWEFSDGGSYSGPTVSRTYATKGTYTATVTVSDGDGETKSKTLTVQVGDSAPPVFEQAVADRTSGPAPLEVWFHAVARDPDGGRVTYRWDFGDGGAAFGDEVEHTYLTPGTYTAEVTATDPTGASATEEIVITVSDAPGNQAPSVVALADRQSGAAPLAVQFSAEGTDPDGDTLSYAWDFGDGTTGSGRRARHTYTANGTYTAEVTVDDGRGGTATDEVVVVVGNPAGNQAPTVQALADRSSGTAPLTVTLTAQGNDPDGDAFVYTWDFKDGGMGAGAKVTHTFTQPGTYPVAVTVKDEHGAEGTATVTITVNARTTGQGSRPAARAMVRPLSKPSVLRFAKRGLKVAATCAADGNAAVGLWATKKTARKLGLESRGLSRRQLSCAAGETVQVRLKPSRRVRKAIRAVKPKRLVVSVALAHRDGDVVTRKVTLKR